MKVHIVAVGKLKKHYIPITMVETKQENPF